MDFAASLEPLPGGWSGRTFLADAGGERTVVRIYPADDPRGPDAPEVDAAVLALVRGLLPVPDVLEVRRAAHEVPGLLVTAWLPGERGDLALARFDDSRRATMGAAMGRVAGTLAGMPTLRAGVLADPDLSIRPFPSASNSVSTSGLPEWVAAHRGGLHGWTPAELDALGDLAEHAEALLTTARRTCLVHSDLNPKNVLVDDEGHLTAVLDWEFAHSGHPMTDLGNVLRFDRAQPYATAALQAYVDLRGGEPQQVLDAARAADLWALVELAARGVRNPVADRAEELLRTLARSADLHAWPH